MQFDSMTVEVHNHVGTSSYSFLKRGLCYFNKKSLSNTPKIYGFTHGLFNKAVAGIYTTYCPVITDRLRKNHERPIKVIMRSDQMRQDGTCRQLKNITT